MRVATTTAVRCAFRIYQPPTHWYLPDTQDWYLPDTQDARGPLYSQHGFLFPARFRGEQQGPVGVRDDEWVARDMISTLR